MHRSEDPPSRVPADAASLAEIALRGAELEEAHARLDAALNTMSHGLLMVDQDLRVVLCNPQLRALFDLDPDIVRPGASLTQVVAHSIARGNHPGLTLDQVTGAMRRRAARGVRSAFEQTLPDGRLVSANWAPMRDGGWVCTYDDITEHVATAARAAYLARHDPVTGLPNRQALHEALCAAWPLAQPPGRGGRQHPTFHLLCVEIDRFQALCDSCGHGTGDMVLQDAAGRLRACLRADDFAAHLGGPSFAVLQTTPSSREAALRLAVRVTEAMQAPIPILGRTTMATVSIGVASPHDAASPQTGAEEILRNATLALHHASAGGGGRAQIYAPDMDVTAQARQALETDLRGALAGGQFELHYQPLVSVARRRVTGFEALLRWRHPHRGLIQPDLFIPLAEELGLIAGIGGWVLRTACAEAATWPRDVHLAVNLSPLQFSPHAGPSLPVLVAAALTQSGLDGARLELEITESVRLQDDPATLRTLHALRDLGVRISLDDFGTGYSSLSYLRCFPFDKIKIDQSFVRGLPDTDASAIVHAIACLGASLGIATVAEGVETEAQLRALVAETCDEMQGYLFSPPRPASEVPGLINRALSRIAA